MGWRLPRGGFTVLLMTKEVLAVVFSRRIVRGLLGCVLLFLSCQASTALGYVRCATGVVAWLRVSDELNRAYGNTYERIKVVQVSLTTQGHHGDRKDTLHKMKQKAIGSWSNPKTSASVNLLLLAFMTGFKVELKGETSDCNNNQFTHVALDRATAS